MKFWLRIYFIISAIKWLRYVTANTHNFTIGGLFNLFDSFGNVNDSQLEHVHAFILAIHEINNNKILFPNITINFVIRNSHGVSGAQKSIINLVESSPEIIGIVGTLGNEARKSLDLTLNDYGIVMAHSLATDTDLGDSSTYKYKVQTCPIDSYQGMVLEGVVCNQNISRVVLFASQSNNDLKSMMEFFDEQYCIFEPLNIYTFQTFTVNFTSIVIDALSLQATAFVLFMSSPDAAALIEEGHKWGLFHEGTQLYGNSAVLSTLTLQSFSNTTDVKAVMKGIIGVKYWPNYSQWRSDRGLQFVEAWRSQYNTKDNCSQHVDVSGAHYLTAREVCYGIDFSQYDANASQLSPQVVLTYDATYVIAHGLQYMVDNYESYTRFDMRDAIVTMPSFIGASGLINIFDGINTFGSYGGGDREVGHHYSIINFNAQQYDLNINNSFVRTGIWSKEDGITDCPVDVECFDLILNNPENKIIDGYPPYVLDEAPDVIKIGALFTPVKNNAFDVTQGENLAAFLLALSHINNKTDGIADDILPDSKIVFQLETGGSYIQAVQSSANLLSSFMNSGIHGVVGSLPSDETMATNLYNADFELVHVHSMAMDTDLGNGVAYPYKVQTCPIDSYYGMALQSLVCTFFSYTKVAVFASDTNFGSKTFIEFIDESYCKFDVLSKISFPTSTRDFSEYITLAKASGATVFIIISAIAKNAANLLEQGYNSGLFHSKTQIFITPVSITPEFYSSFSNPQNIPEYLKGIVSLEYYPQYNFIRSERGRDFTRWWRQQDYTGPVMKYGRSVCNNAQDDATQAYLYRSVDGSVCAGLNFSSYSDDLSEINPFAALTYDAAFVLLRGIDFVLKNNMELTGNNIRAAIFNNVSFEGVTGHVSIYEGMKDFGYYARGDRETGHVYKVTIFDESRYYINPNTSFQQIYYWTSEGGVFDCDEFMTCVEPIYRTNSHVFPSDTPDTIVITMSSTFHAILIALGASLWLGGVVSLVLLWYYRQKKLIKASQPIMLITILAGVFFAGGRVLNAALPITTPSCVVGLWLGHFAFVFVFGGLFLKTWRVYCLVCQAYKKVKITNNDISRRMALIVAIATGYMLLLTFIGQPREGNLSTVVANQQTDYPRCPFEYAQFHTALFAIEAVVMAYGLKLCYAVKDLPDAINESKFIAFGKCKVM